MAKRQHIEDMQGSASSTQELRFWALAPEAVVAALDSNAESGISSEAARARRARDGDNALREGKPTPLLRQFLRQFTDITVIALLVAALLALVLALLEEEAGSPLSRFGDAIAIGIIVTLNAVIGFVQERKAEHALRALRKLGAPQATVVRDGRVQHINAREIVVGDLVELREGNRVAADGRLLAADDLQVTEAALTGESLPVEKRADVVLAAEAPLAERENIVFMGTHIARGTGRAIVTHTGAHTELGRVAELLAEVESPQTPLQQSLRRFGQLVVIGCAVVGAIVFGVGMLRLDAPVGFLLLTAVSLAVAAIPEGLPAITTIVLALGVQRMAKKQALIRRLAAVETLGSANVICTDKTGTLTQNKMSARRALAGFTEVSFQSNSADRPTVAAGQDASSDAFKLLVQACGFAPAAHIARSESGAEEVRGAPTDVALLELHVALLPAAERVDQTHISERVIPFDRQRNLSTVIARGPESLQGFTHGAPESVLERASSFFSESGTPQPLDSAARERFEQVIQAWAGVGLRVLALACVSRNDDEPPQSFERQRLEQDYETELTLIGLVGLADPPRMEVAAALKRAAQAGVATVMITGDHPVTAAAISRELGILTEETSNQQVVSGLDLDRLSNEELRESILDVRVVARATAENKLRLVEAFKSRGQVVAMTGDGVNDAPAIKAASIGVAMGRAGTDVTREAADMVLLDDNYATIVSAIEEGRIVYGNIKRFIIFLFAVNWGLVLSVFVAAALGWPAIMTPTQILWINLITNGLPALALGMEPVHLSPMQEPPRRADAPLVYRGELLWLLGHGTFMALLGLGIYWHYSGGTALVEQLPLARTATFTVLAIGPLFHALNARSLSDSVLSLGLTSNWRLLGAFMAALGLQALAVYMPALAGVFSTVPLSLEQLGVVMALAASVWVVGELEKALRRLRRSV